MKKILLSVALISSLSIASLASDGESEADLYDYYKNNQVVTPKGENSETIVLKDEGVAAISNKDKAVKTAITQRDKFIAELKKKASIYHIEIDEAKNTPLYKGEKQYYIREYPTSDMLHKVADSNMEAYLEALINKKIMLCKNENRIEATTLQKKAIPSRTDKSCLIAPRDERLVQNYVKTIDAMGLMEEDEQKFTAFRVPNSEETVGINASLRPDSELSRYDDGIVTKKFSPSELSEPETLNEAFEDVRSMQSVLDDIITKPSNKDLRDAGDAADKSKSKALTPINLDLKR